MILYLIGIFLFSLNVFANPVSPPNKPQENTQVKLFEAVQNRDNTSIQAMIKNGLDINAAINSWSPLAGAYLNWCSELKSQATVYPPEVKELIEKDKKKQILSDAAFVDFLYSVGAVPGIKSSQGSPMLRIFSSSVGCDDKTVPIEHLLKHKFDLNTVDEIGNTPLHMVAQSGNLTIATILLKYRPNLAIKNKEGFNPLDLAIKEFQTPIADLLKASGGTFSSDVAALYKLRGFGRNDLSLTSITLDPNPEDALAMVRSAKQPLTIGETRNVTAVIKGEAKAVTLQLVDAQNKPIKTEIRVNYSSRYKAELRQTFSVVLPPVPFRLWISLQNLDGAFVVNRFETDVHTAVAAKPNAPKFLRPTDPKQMMSFMLSKAYGVEIKVINEPTAKDIEKIYGKWVRCVDYEGFVEAIKNGQKPPASLETFNSSALFEISNGNCKMTGRAGNTSNCETKISNGIISVEEKMEPKSDLDFLGSSKYGVYLTNVGPFLASREMVPSPLVPLGNKSDALASLGSLVKQQFKQTLNINISKADLEKLVGKWTEEKDLGKKEDQYSPSSSIGSFEVVKGPDGIFFVDEFGTVPIEAGKGYIELMPIGQNKKNRYFALADNQLIAIDSSVARLFRFKLAK